MTASDSMLTFSIPYLLLAKGHGGQIPDEDGDEEDGYDEILIPGDYKESGQIVDDWIYSEFVSKVKAGVHVVAIVDCCHSGTAMDLPYVCNVGEHEIRRDDGFKMPVSGAQLTPKKEKDGKKKKPEKKGKKVEKKEKKALKKKAGKKKASDSGPEVEAEVEEDELEPEIEEEDPEAEPEPEPEPEPEAEAEAEPQEKKKKKKGLKGLFGRKK